MRLQLRDRSRVNFDSILDSLLSSQIDPAAQTPPVDIWEDDEKYMLEAELPGLSAKDIDVNINNDILTISSAEKKKNSSIDKNEKKWISRERVKRKFSRSFLVPEKADKSSIKAGFNDGILNLEIKKQKEKKPSSIKIDVK